MNKKEWVRIAQDAHSAYIHQKWHFVLLALGVVAIRALDLAISYLYFLRLGSQWFEVETYVEFRELVKQFGFSFPAIVAIAPKAFIGTVIFMEALYFLLITFSVSFSVSRKDWFMRNTPVIGIVPFLAWLAGGPISWIIWSLVETR